MESESLDFTGLKIPRDYNIRRRDDVTALKNFQHRVTWMFVGLGVLQTLECFQQK